MKKLRVVFCGILTIFFVFSYSFAVLPTFTVTFQGGSVSSGKFDVSIYHQKVSLTQRIGNANYWFTYNSAALSNPVIKTHGIFNNASFNDYNTSTLTSGTFSGSPYVSYNITFNGAGDNGQGQQPATGAPGTLVCTIEFDITNAAAASTLAFQTGGYAVTTDVGTSITLGGTWTSTDNTPLPVEIASFTASVNNINAALKWSTATEVNNYGFEIERRAIKDNTSEISQWAKIGFVQGAGTSSSPKEYSYVDANATAGRYAYRLKQVDNNGAFKYTQELELTIEVPKIFALNQNYPNPFNPTTTITFTLAQDGITALRIFDILGREVATLANAEMKAGVVQKVTFDASRFSSGIYFSCLENNGQRQIKKIMLMK